MKIYREIGNGDEAGVWYNNSLALTIRGKPGDFNILKYRAYQVSETIYWTFGETDSFKATNFQVYQ